MLYAYITQLEDIAQIVTTHKLANPGAAAGPLENFRIPPSARKARTKNPLNEKILKFRKSAD